MNDKVALQQRPRLRDILSQRNLMTADKHRTVKDCIGYTQGWFWRYVETYFLADTPDTGLELVAVTMHQAKDTC